MCVFFFYCWCYIYHVVPFLHITDTPLKAHEHLAKPQKFIGHLHRGGQPIVVDATNPPTSRICCEFHIHHRSLDLSRIMSRTLCIVEINRVVIGVLLKNQ